MKPGKDKRARHGDESNQCRRLVMKATTCLQTEFDDRWMNPRAPGQFSPVLEQHSELTMKPGLKLFDATEIDDLRAIHPQELLRIQLALQALDRSAQFIHLNTDVKFLDDSIIHPSLFTLHSHSLPPSLPHSPPPPLPHSPTPPLPHSPTPLHNGIFPCFFAGFWSRFVSSISSARINFGLVYLGSI